MQLVTTNSNKVGTTQTQNNLQTAAAHAAKAHADNTNRSYKNDLKLVSAYFPNFLNSTYQVITPLTATDVAAFIGHLINVGYTKNGIQQVYKPSSLGHLLNTISSTHKVANLDSPITKAVRAIIVGYGKTLTGGKAYQQKQAKALTNTTITKAINKDAFDLTTKRGLRDKAIILVGFAACLRRNEIASLKVSDLSFDKEGVNIVVVGGKTGTYKKYVPLATDTDTCTVTALKQWITAANLTKTDFLFCSIIKGDTITPSQKIAGETVRRILQTTFGNEYTGHSLRVGFAVTAKTKGASVNDIQLAGGWKNATMVNHYTEQVTAKQNAIKIF
jgi:site-specific recombinase XerD